MIPSLVRVRFPSDYALANSQNMGKMNQQLRLNDAADINV